MQTDEEVGKIAIVTPILISKCLELFMQHFVDKTVEITNAKHGKTMSVNHIRQCVQNEQLFDFLSDTVDTFVNALPPSKVDGDATPKRGRPRKERAEAREEERASRR